MGGRLLEVAQSHAVGTASLSAFADDPSTNIMRNPDRAPPKPRPDGKWIYCEQGDLAVEILYVKTRQIAGHSYLSGPAINLNRYTPAAPGWFRDEPLTGAMVVETEDALPERSIPDDGVWPALVKMMVNVRFGAAAIYGMEMHMEREEPTAEQIVQLLVRAWKHVPKDMTDEEVRVRARSHLLALVHMDNKKHGNVATVHFQPPRHASDYCATGFQIGLVLGALKDGRIKRPTQVDVAVP